MVDHQSKEVVDKISDELKIQPSLQIPRGISKEIQLSYNVNPRKRIQVSRVSGADASSVAIFTTSTTKKTFLIGVSLSVSKDVVNDGKVSSITATPLEGSSETILEIRYEPITAGQFTETIMFQHAIELKKATAVGFINGSALASIDAAGIAYFYETDPQ